MTTYEAATGYNAAIGYDGSSSTPISVAVPVLALSVALLVPGVSAGSAVTVAPPVMAVSVAAPAPTVTITTYGAYENAVLTDSPVAYYKLDESSGATLIDSSGNARNGTWVGSPTRGVSGAVNTAFTTGAGGGEVTDAAWNSFTGAFTLEAWHKPNGARCHIVEKFSTSGLNDGYALRLDGTTGKLVGYSLSSGSTASLTSPSAISTGVWHHYAFTYDGTNGRLYVDGSLVAGPTAMAAPSDGSSNLMIGRRGNDSLDSSGGDVDEVALYSSALSAGRVLAHYDAPSAGIVDVDVPVAALTTTLLAPTVTAGTTITVAVPVAAVTVEALAPIVDVSKSITVAPPVMEVTTAAPAPVVSAGSAVAVDVPVAAVTFAALAPTVNTTDTTLTIAVPVMSLAFAAPDPTVTGVTAVEPTAVARVNTPSGARAIIPLVAATPPVSEEPMTRCSVLMAPLSETHPVHDRLDCSEADNEIVREVIGYPQLFIGGRNVTYLRGVPTVIRRWESEVPFGDTVAAFEFPQLNPWDADGVDDLDFLTKDAPVAIGIADTEGNVRRVWSGYLDARGNGIGQGEDYAREAKGTLWAAMHTVREPFPFTDPIDIGVLIARTLNSVVSKRWADMPEKAIGITTLTRGSRDQKHWEFVQELLSEAWTDDGRQWTLAEVAPGIFDLQLKPLPSTVHATVAYGTPGVEIDLRVDESTRVDGVFARAIAPDAGGWANIFYPALELLNPPPYPNADPDQYMNLGDTDAGTDSGTGVSDWQRRVVEIGAFDTPAVSGVMSSAWVAVAEEVQRSIGVTVDGSVGPQTWNATFDRGGEGIDMRPLRLPLAMKSWVWPTLHSATGVVTGANPAYTGTESVPKFIAVDLGPKKTKNQGRKISRNILTVYGEAEAFGTIEWTFDPNEIDRTRLTHLTNVKVTGHESEDRVLMVARKVVELEKGEEGPVYVVTTTVDQRARDAMEVEDLLAQRRSAEADPSRRPGNPPKSSRQVADQRTPWDSESPCGVLRRTAVNGSNGLPSVITLPFAEVGKLARIELHSTQPFAFLICASLRITENIAQSIVGDPFASSDPFRSVKDQLDEYGVIEGWGELGNACGYSPLTEAPRPGGGAGGPFTGDFILDTPVDYWTETVPYVSVVVWMRGDSGFIEGRFFPAYEGA